MQQKNNIQFSLNISNKSLIMITLLFTVMICLSVAYIAHAEDTNNSATPKEENEVNTQQTPDSSFIYDIPISDLAEATAYYDNKEVQVEGEVIGDRIVAEETSDYCWITLTSLDLNTHTLAVYMKNADANLIDTYGVYGKTGTRLRVRGFFHLACDQHQGISCLHAENVSVVEPGKMTPTNINFSMFVLGTLLAVCGLLLIFLYKFIRDKMR